MDPFFVDLVLASAALYAGWHTFVKASGDRLVSLATVALGYAITGTLMMPFVGSPAQASWMYIAATTLLYYLFSWLLIRLYLIGDLSHAFPLSRGAAPLLVTIEAALVGGEWLQAKAVLGVALTCAGIMSLALFGASPVQKRRSELYLVAAAASVVIATMMVSNGIGARKSGAPFAYMAWVFLLQAPVVGVTATIRRGKLVAAIKNEPLKAAGTGLCAPLAWGLSIYASAYAPMGGVSALRETSVVMAALLGTIVLGERPWLPRVLATCLVTAGALLVAISGPR
jgi:uncharacterized membrane protein